MKEAIHTVLNATLAGQVYEPEYVGDWSKEISDNIKAKIKELGYDRYKVESLLKTEIVHMINQPSCQIVVEVVIGEQRGEGVRMGTRCLWDSDTDNFASDVFMNDSLFCCAAAFGIYYY